MTTHYNSLTRLSIYLNANAEEFMHFWNSMTPAERKYYQSLDLDTGKPCVERICRIPSHRH